MQNCNYITVLIYYLISYLQKNNKNILFNELSILPHFQPLTENSFNSLRASTTVSVISLIDRFLRSKLRLSARFDDFV